MVVKEVKDRIREIFKESVRTKERFLENNLEVLAEVIRTLGSVVEGGNKIVFFGNGGSAADAQHLAAEFVNRYLTDRPPLAALALTTDTSVLTAIANDFDWSEVFSKQIRALGKAGDAAVGISTSGRSSNVVKGLETARDLGLVTIGIGGPADAPMRRLCRHYLTVDSAITPRIQETHLLVGHTIVELLDEMLFGGRASA
jgi:D-sedoheptulose 7-phosphate isomerase